MTSDLILEILLVAGAAYAMFKAGAAYTIWRIQQDLIALENGEIEFVDEEGDDSQPTPGGEFLNIVKEGGAFYAYGENDRFLTQGKDIHELLTNVKDNFPGTTWYIANENKTLTQEEQDSILPTLKTIFEGPSNNE